MNITYLAEKIDSSAIYDLGILKIQKESELSVLEMADTAVINQLITSVGYPQSIFRITQGRILRYMTIADHDISFPVLAHTSYIASGSSGGALVNNQLEIIGINFAGYNDEFGHYVEGYAIPFRKINEYLQTIQID